VDISICAASLLDDPSVAVVAGFEDAKKHLRSSTQQSRGGEFAW